MELSHSAHHAQAAVLCCSKGASPIIAQYYQFIRLGFEVLPALALLRLPMLLRSLCRCAHGLQAASG